MFTAHEWDVLCIVEEFWHRHRFFPGLQDISELAGLSEEIVRSALFSENVTRGLEMRGISRDATPPTKKGELGKNQTRLTDKQLAVAMTLLNVADNRSLTTKLESLGVKSTTYHGWTKSKVFMDFMNQQAEEMFGSAMPMAHKALINKVMAGDVRAMKLYYEMTGRWNGQQSQETANVKMIIIRLIEIMQKYISDPIILKAIAEEMKSLSPTTFATGNDNANHKVISAIASGD